ncbi:hypothetical protein FHS10_000092 [Mucilaginibacter dorajii]|nr:hypothetical protein [Mucilaginibacter dorajii]
MQIALIYQGVYECFKYNKVGFLQNKSPFQSDFQMVVYCSGKTNSVDPTPPIYYPRLRP